MEAKAAVPKKARAPRKKKSDDAAEAAPTEPQTEAQAVMAMRRKPYSCAECERIFQQEGKAGFCASSCQMCGMPVYFRKLADVREYNRNRAGRCPVCGHVGTCVCIK